MERGDKSKNCNIKDGFVIILVSQGRKPKPREVNYPVWGNRVSMWQNHREPRQSGFHSFCTQPALGTPLGVLRNCNRGGLRGHPSSAFMYFHY